MVASRRRRAVLTTPEVVNYYKFNGDSIDSVGGIDGTDANITYVTGTNHTRAYFNGTTSKVTFTNYLVSDLSEFSFTMLIQVDAIGARQDLFAQIASPYSLFMRLWNDGSFAGMLYTSTDTGPTSATIPIGSIVVDTVYHIGFTYSGYELNIYLDGVLMDTQTKTGLTGAGVTAAGLPQFGAILANSNSFAGYLENAKVWDYPMSETEMLEEANNELYPAWDFVTDLVTSAQFNNNPDDYIGAPYNEAGTISYSTGVVEERVDFGTQSYYQKTSNTNAFDLTDDSGNDTPGAFCFWIWDTTVSTGNQWKFLTSRYANSGDRAIFIGIDTTTDVLEIRFNDTTGADYIYAQLDISSYDNTSAYHIGVQFNCSGTGAGSEDDFEFIENGVVLDYADSRITRGEVGTYPGMSFVSEPLIIGGRRISPANSDFRGSMDEFKMYKNRVLTAEEWAYMYSQELGGTSVLP